MQWPFDAFGDYVHFHSFKSWIHKNTERLIKAVKASEVLYNMTLDGYKNNKVTNNKWDEIGSILGMKGK